ncbi:Excisionase [Fimbriiglobus ruber]|uniref:Excisionase n=2 Tax=Fimbriiglobus ruber TaxID=1908690 RepID=A0A225DKP0_9BACT|nr:Excisionase [Fimbriiglobus ruber]
MLTLLPGTDLVTPTTSEAAAAKELSRTLAAHVGESGDLRLRMTDAAAGKDLVLSPPVTRLLLGILAEMGRGNAVALSPVQAELTSGEAADLLNASQPYVSKLLDEGIIPSRQVGTHRRVMLADVLAYKKELSAKRHVALEAMSALDQELGLY